MVITFLYCEANHTQDSQKEEKKAYNYQKDSIWWNGNKKIVSLLVCF